MIEQEIYGSEEIFYIHDGKILTEDFAAQVYGVKYWKAPKTGEVELTTITTISMGNKGEQYVLHREYGPAVLDGYERKWYIDGRELGDVSAWIEECKLPNYPQWTRREKTLFKLRWW